MDKSSWGPQMWHSMHMIALGYPEHPKHADRVMYRKFYSELGQVLPCAACTVNYKKHLDELPIDKYLDDNAALFEWTVKLHNVVNLIIHKPTLTLDEARTYYMTYQQVEKSLRGGAIWLILLGVAVTVPLGFMVHNRLKRKS